MLGRDAVEYRADRRFTALGVRTRRNHESGMRLVGAYKLKDGRRLGEVRLSAITTAITDVLYQIFMLTRCDVCLMPMPGECSEFEFIRACPGENFPVFPFFP